MNNITLPADDRLLLFGYGIFETVLITTSGPKLLHLHWQRMNNGAKLLKLSLPDFSAWAQQIHSFLLTPSLAPPYALRVTLSGGAPARNFPSQLILQNRPFPYKAPQFENGICLHLLSTSRNEYSQLNKIKSTNYLENIMAKEEALENNADEGLWLNTQKYLVEGTMSNIFFISKQTLYTPSLACGCLPGTRRSVILKLAAKLRIPVFEGYYTQEDLFRADEVFVTNALMGIMPVRKINNQSFKVVSSGRSDSITRFLEHEFSQFLVNN
jgi:4-amino-4-deoxychorismate lyase